MTHSCLRRFQPSLINYTWNMIDLVLPIGFSCVGEPWLKNGRVNGEVRLPTKFELGFLNIGK